jgi:hypothetical protein
MSYPSRRPDWLASIVSPDVSFKRALTSKLARTIYAAITLFSLAAVFLSWKSGGTLSNPIPYADDSKIATPLLDDVPDYTPPPGPKHEKGRFHLLIPATSSGRDLCKLLLSTQILGYPTPVLINYGAAEDADPYVQHLAKVEGLLNYLEKQESANPDTEDLVLIIDGYDVWFQLRPDVLIKRFYESNKQAYKRLVDQYGTEIVKKNNMKQSVIFGPDKLCWPIDYSRPACWAVDPGNLDPHAFGPQTSSEHEELTHPRWLNSGTIMGTTQELIDVFRATLHDIQTNYVTNSDQYYFAEIYGRQEFARLSQKPELLIERKKEMYGVTVENKTDNGTRAEPDLSGQNRTEYFIGIDYKSEMFQTLAFWKQFLTWSRGRDSWQPPLGARDMLPYTVTNSSVYDTRLAGDIVSSEKPFSSLKESENEGDRNMATTRWSDVELLRNTVSRLNPVIIHFTGEKRFREVWWTRLWFQAKAETLRKESSKQNTNKISDQLIEGMTWYNAEPEQADEVSNAGKSGAWSDKGGWFGWNTLCKAHEPEMYYNGADDFGLYHPDQKPAQENLQDRKPPADV